MRIFCFLIAALCLALAGLGAARAATTLDTVRERGALRCGVSTGLAGFSLVDSQGRWSGLDVEFCRAIAAAVLGDTKKVEFVPLSAQQRFTALQSGEVDVLSRNTTWTLKRDAALGFNFTGVTFYDGQGFMVHRELGVAKVEGLDGAAICVQPGTTTELNLADTFRARGLAFEPVVIESIEEATSAYFSGRCDAFTADASSLAAIRATNAPDPAAHLILKERISKEPLSPLVRHGDDQWFDIVKWVINATIAAEEKGITAANIDSFLKSRDPTVHRLLGRTPGMGEALGLDAQWAARAIRQVGNYGEIFERNVGVDTPLGLERGLNDLWTRGGLIYAYPFR
jgi:general L-amino acid transport system substrate-binding protein